MKNNLTLEQIDVISHAFGIDLYKSAMSHKLKDKSLPKEFYRNRYQKKSDPIFDKLVNMGYAEKTKWQDLDFYMVTREGEIQFRKQFEEIVNYKPKKERDLNYLKHRINFYTSWNHYRFCEDNSDHIISAYLNYWIKKYRVSHTTEDTIIKFNSELRSYNKKGLLKSYFIEFNR